MRYVVYDPVFKFFFGLGNTAEEAQADARERGAKATVPQDYADEAEKAAHLLRLETMSEFVTVQTDWAEQLHRMEDGAPWQWAPDVLYEDGTFKFNYDF